MNINVDQDDYEICFIRPGEIDVHIKVSSKAVTFKPGSVCICELEADDCGEYDLLIKTMEELGKRNSIHLWVVQNWLKLLKILVKITCIWLIIERVPKQLGLFHIVLHKLDEKNWSKNFKNT